MIACWHISNLVTYLGMLSSVAGICLAASGRPALAVLALIITGICDLMDGPFARRFKRSESQRAFGVQIDSLADVLGFAALPVTILFAAGLSAWYFWPILALYAICAASRLAFFNVSLQGADTEVSVKYFTGLPVTYSAMIWPVVWMLSYLLDQAIFVPVMAAVAVVLAVLFVLNFKNRKPRGLLYIAFFIFAVIVAAVILILEFVR